MNKNTILKNIEDLSNNAMFAMSQTSKELFHSNFWAWMLRKYPQIFTKVFYPKYDEKSKIEVFREKHHFDLMLKIDDETIIIENKFKSMPCQEQLKNYYEKIETEKKKIILISYFKPLFYSTKIDLEEYISYETLSRRLQSVFCAYPASAFKGNDWFVVNDYIDFLELLNKFQNCIEIKPTDKIGDLWAIIKDNDIQKESSKINFSKTLERILTIKLTDEVLKHFAFRKFIDEIRIDCGKDLNMFSDILFYFPGAWDEDECKRQDLCFLGISLWGNDYRYYAGLHKAQCGILNSKNGRMDKENKTAGFKYLCENYSWFFEQENAAKWNGYSNDKEMYLYKKLDVSNWSVKELSEKAVQDLELIHFYIEPMRNEKCQG